MELNINDIVIYSLPLDGERRGSIFTSIGQIQSFSGSHANVRVADKSNFPYSREELPDENITTTTAPDKVDLFKIPLIFIRRVMDPKTPFSPAVLEGIITKNGEHVFTKWSTIDKDYVFRTITFYFQGLNAKSNPTMICDCNHKLTEPLELEDGKVYATPLDASDPAQLFILKQAPNAVLLRRVNRDACVPVSCTTWTKEQLRDYLHKKLLSELQEIGCFKFTQIKAVRHSPAGYYAFTNDDTYIDTRAFLGTVYFDPDLEEFKISSFDAEKREKDENGEFFHGPFFKEGHSLFIGDDVSVSEERTMVGFYNISLPINNLLLLLEHGPDHELFKGDVKRAFDFMITPAYPYPKMQSLAKFVWNPTNTSKENAKWRQRYLWWFAN
jgi:hypothetical protein